MRRLPDSTARSTVQVVPTTSIPSTLLDGPAPRKARTRTRAGCPRTSKIPAIVRWPVAGGLLALGALAVAKWLGPGVAREVGADAGAGFAQGMARFAELKQTITGSGRWTRAR